VAAVAAFGSVKISIREAKNQLSKYGNLAHHGEVVTVCKHGKPWFDLVPHKSSSRSIQPLVKSEPLNTIEAALSPVVEKDNPGWM